MNTSPKKNRRWDVFISYTQRDIEYARQTKRILQAAGWQTFLAHDDLNEQVGSAEWSSAVDTAIDESGCLVLIVSPKSLESKWVEYEWRSVHTEILNRKPGMIIPACWDEKGPEDLPRALRRYQSVDFRHDPGERGEDLLDLVEGWLQTPIGRQASQDLVRILTIDGGGVKGLVTLKVLESLEAKLTERKGSPAMVREYFDLITGASIGTMITALLSHPEKGRVSDVIETLAGFAPKVLKKPTFAPVRLMCANSMFPERVLTDSVNSVFGDLKLGELATRCVFPTYDVEEGRLKFFHSHLDPDKEYLVKDILRATLAAPFYFPSTEVAGRELIDAAIVVNNPTRIGFDEARKNFPNRPLTSEIALLSMGNVRAAPIGSTKDWKTIKWIGTSVDLAISGSSSQITEIVSGSFEAVSALDQFLRIEADQPPEQQFDFYDGSKKNIGRLLDLGAATAEVHDNTLEQFADLLVHGKNVARSEEPEAVATPRVEVRGQ